MIYLELFFVYFRITLFSFGGGYAAMPLIQSLIVEGKKWLTMAEFADLMTIAEMTPGPIIINSATFVGQKMAGLLGAIICTLGTISPSLIIVLTLAYLYSRYKDIKVIKIVLQELRPAVVAMIAGAGLTIILMAFFNTTDLSNIQTVRPIEILLFLISFICIRKFKTNPIVIIFSTALIGTLLYLIL